MEGTAVRGLATGFLRCSLEAGLGRLRGVRLAEQGAEVVLLAGGDWRQRLQRPAAAGAYTNGSVWTQTGMGLIELYATASGPANAFSNQPYTYSSSHTEVLTPYYGSISVNGLYFFMWDEDTPDEDQLAAGNWQLQATYGSGSVQDSQSPQEVVTVPDGNHYIEAQTWAGLQQGTLKAEHGFWISAVL